MNNQTNYNIQTGKIEEDQVYTVKEIANFMRVSERKAYNMCDNGVFPIKRFGKTIRIPITPFNK